jgi:CheY-like chemotaxis protein
MKVILQVEDDPNDVFFLQHAMKKAGVENTIQVAQDGQEAIGYLKGAGKFANRQEFPFPCLVLLDLKLPHIMGLDVLKWIRQQHGMLLVVVVLTASGEESDIATAYRLGANGFLIKPSQASKLEDMAKAIRDFWLTHNTLPPPCSPDAPQKGAVSPVHSRRLASAGQPRPPTDGKGRKP